VYSWVLIIVVVWMEQRLADSCFEVELSRRVSPKMVRLDDIFSMDDDSLCKLFRGECLELIEEVLVGHDDIV
jgi:hypothetical protein